MIAECSEALNWPDAFAVVGTIGIICGFFLLLVRSVK